MDGQFILTQGAGQKLEFAINRNGGGIDDIEWLSAGDNFKTVMMLARGEAEVAVKAKTVAVVKKPTLIFIKQTLLGTTQVTVYGLGKRLTIAQMLCAGMKLAPGTSPDALEKFLKERKNAVSPERADEMLDKQGKFFLKQEGGEDFGLRGDGWANLIPVQYPDGTVSVVDADWVGSRWRRYRYSLGFDYVWYVAYRLVLGNSDASSI